MQNIVRHLRSLPQEMRQPYDWSEFRRRVRARAAADARATLHRKQYAAIAAVSFLVLVGLAAWIRNGAPGTTEWTQRQIGRSADSVEERADLEERWLATLPNEPIVVRVGTRAAVAGLEDRIAQLDDVLSAARVEGAQPANLAALEERRARLVNSLVQVRYAETLVSQSR